MDSNVEKSSVPTVSAAAEVQNPSSAVITSENAIPQKVIGEAGKIEQENQASPSRNVHGIRWFLIVASLLSSTFFFGLDNTVVANLQPALVDKFGSIDRLPWLSVAFLIGAASTNFF